MSKFHRECRDLVKKPGSYKKPHVHFAPATELIIDPWRDWRVPRKVDQSVFVYHSRDIVKENSREQRLYKPKQAPTRQVPAFSIQSRQAHTTTIRPSLTSQVHNNAAGSGGGVDTKPEDCARFRQMYDRRDLPLKIDHGTSGAKLKRLHWLRSPESMDLAGGQNLLLRFCLGLPILEQPYRFVAERGLNDLLEMHDNPTGVIASCLPQVATGIRAALNQPDLEKQKSMLNLLSKLVHYEHIGPALVPYYRQLLPPLRRICPPTSITTSMVNINNQSMDALIEQTLHNLEKYGGPNAFINIKYLIPTYESCEGSH